LRALALTFLTWLEIGRVKREAFGGLDKLEGFHVKIDKQMKNDVVILRLSGDLTGGPDAVLFHDMIKQIIADGNKKVLADLGKVMIVNSTGLGILIAALTSMKNAGGILKLLNVSKRVESLLMVTKLILIFDVFENENEALASFS